MADKLAKVGCLGSGPRPTLHHVGFHVLLGLARVAGIRPPARNRRRGRARTGRCR